MTHDPSELLLAVHALTKRFGGLVALDQLDLEIKRGEILGLIGPNGSGKTTFFNVVTGLYGADGGNVRFDGADITRATPQAVYHAGISRTFQRSRLSLPLSIFDNIMIGNHKRLSQGLWFNIMRRGAFREEFAASYEEARALVEVFDAPLADRLLEPVGGLPMIDRRRIEICRALISRPKLLLLDEPSAGMTHDETKQLMDDILDYTGTEKELGKPPRQDLREGKVTLPLLHALREAGAGDRAAAAALLARKDRSERDISFLARLVDRCGGIEYTARSAKRYVDRGKEFLEALPDSKAREALRSLSDYIVMRSR